MDIKVVCAECGEEMEIEMQSMGPGWNGLLMKVKPCCIPSDSTLLEERNTFEQDVMELRETIETLLSIQKEVANKYAERWGC